MRLVSYEELIQKTEEFSNELIDLALKEQTQILKSILNLSNESYTFDQKK